MQGWISKEMCAKSLFDGGTIRIPNRNRTLACDFQVMGMTKTADSPLDKESSVWILKVWCECEYEISNWESHENYQTGDVDYVRETLFLHYDFSKGTGTLFKKRAE